MNIKLVEDTEVREIKAPKFDAGKKYKLAGEASVQEVLDNFDLNKNEEDLLDMWGTRVNNKIYVGDNKLAQELDNIFQDNLRIKRANRNENAALTNLLVIGEPGTGKTHIIQNWAARHNINLVTELTSTDDPGDFSGIPAKDEGDPRYSQKLGTKSFDSLNQKNQWSVLFLDEVNRADPRVVSTLLTMVNDHTIPDFTKKNKLRGFDNYLFTIAAINPEDEGAEDLSKAFRGRHKIFKMENPTPEQFYNYLEHKITTEFMPNVYKYAKTPLQRQMADRDMIIWKNRLKIAKTILMDPEERFQFKSFQGNQDAYAANDTVTRTFEKALYNCDGTVPSFIESFAAHANRDQVDTIKDILKNLHTTNVPTIQDTTSSVNAKSNMAAAGGSGSIFDNAGNRVRDYFKQNNIGID